MRPSHRPIIVALAILGMLATLVTPVAAEQPPGPREFGTDALARGSWIVTLKADATDAQIRDLVRGVGGKAGLVYDHALEGFQFRGTARAAALLRRSPKVASVQADHAIFLTAETLPFGIQRVGAYGLGGVAGAYQEGFRGNGARIAILDTGIDLDHPDLVASIDHNLGKHCVNPAFQPNDGLGHGTHVAGTAAAPLNGVGVVGVAPEARLVPVKMFSDAGNSSEAIAICALDHIVGLNQDADPANDVDVANMSWGEVRAPGSCENDALHAAICRAHAEGIILVAGAGNSAASVNTFVPAAYPEVISVSAISDFDGKRGGLAGCKFISDLLATECDDTRAFFSNHGPVDVTAPGVFVHSSWVGGGYRTSSGTSMSTPHVAGVAALMAAAAPGLTPADALAAMTSSGECPDGTAADGDGTAGCGGQGLWTDDPDGTAEPMAHALRAAQAVAFTDPDPEPPSAPTLSAEATATSIDLTWTAPATNGGAPVTAYEIYRGSTAGTATLVDTVGVALAWSDTEVATGETWFYEVAAVNVAGIGARSNEVSATVPEPPPPADPPSAPTLSATPGNGSVTLSWTAPAEDGGAPVTAYRVFRGTTAGSATLFTTLGNVLTFKDTGRTNGTTYWYQVAAVNSAGAGPRSNEASATPAAAPSAPRQLKAIPAVGGGVQLTWLAPTGNGGSPLLNYKVYRTGGSGAAGGKVIFTLPPDQLTFTDTTAQPLVWYAYIVSARNAIGESQASNIVLIRLQ